ncbi:integrase [Brevibacterium sp. FME17]|uniref:integrase n=1 Tax=Brevibacterium sp. FME17 TaxID=2742606 RepID=UPI0018673FD6|nr:integrase [Brevibacterium sp. FME17]
MTIESRTAPASQNNQTHPFEGQDIFDAATLEASVDAHRPNFNHDVWDISGLKDAPATMGTFRKKLDFTRIINPQWRLVAKEYLFSRLAPRHPVVAGSASAFRTPLNPSTIWNELRRLTRWFNHLSQTGVAHLGEVDQRHCISYLNEVAWKDAKPEEPISPSTIAAHIHSTQVLQQYTEILSENYAPGFSPWGGKSADSIAEYVRTTENQVPPVPDTILRPLLANTFYLIETIGPLLAAEASRAREFDELQKRSIRGLKQSERPRLRTAIERLQQAGVAAPRLSAAGRAKRISQGWDEKDPLLYLAWHSVVTTTVGAMGHRRDLEELRPLLVAWVNECGIEESWCRDGALVPRLDNQEQIPWAIPADRSALAAMKTAVESAAFFVISALSGMRSSELHEIRGGSLTREDLGNGIYRHRISSRRIKGQQFGGIDDLWVVIEDVYRALGTVESLQDAKQGELLFTKQSNTAHLRYVRLRNWMNGPSGQRLGLAEVPEGPVNPRALRRTLALAIAQRPHGLMAAKYHLKHLSVATTEGYAARPGGHQAAFRAEISAAEESEHLRLTVAAYEDYKQGKLPSGHGARELTRVFASVDEILTSHQPGQATVIDDRRVERLLKAKAESLFVGAANYCWFTDPKKALCLQLAQTPDATEPLIGLCDSGRCPQATHHGIHREAWASHAESVKTVFLGNPRLSKPELGRAQVTLDRANRILTEIDNAGATHEG